MDAVFSASYIICLLKFLKKAKIIAVLTLFLKLSILFPIKLRVLMTFENSVFNLKKTTHICIYVHIYFKKKKKILKNRQKSVQKVIRNENYVT